MSDWMLLRLLVMLIACWIDESSIAGAPMDLIFIAIFVAFFAVSVGLIHFCANLMKERS